MTEIVITGLSVCITMTSIGCLTLAYLMFRRTSNDKQWVREVLGNVQTAYIEGFTDGKAGTPSGPGTSYSPPVSNEPEFSPPLSDANEQIEIGMNG